MFDQLQVFARKTLIYTTKCLHPKNLPYYLLAAGLSYVLIHTGVDWNWFQFFSRHHEYQYTLVSAALIGLVMPTIGPILLYRGLRRRDAQQIETGYSLIQVVVIALLISSVMKVFTGRFPPEPFSEPSVGDYSHRFQFGFLEGGIFEGWPSSHVMTTFAMILCVIRLHRSNRVIVAVSCFYGLYMLIGVSATIHWLSDSLSGAIIGIIIGYTANNHVEKKIINGGRAKVC